MKLFYVVYAIDAEHIITGIYAENYDHVHSILKSKDIKIQILETWELV